MYYQTWNKYKNDGCISGVAAAVALAKLKLKTANYYTAGSTINLPAFCTDKADSNFCQFQKSKRCKDNIDIQQQTQLDISVIPFVREIVTSFYIVSYYIKYVTTFCTLVYESETTVWSICAVHNDGSINNYCLLNRGCVNIHATVRIPGCFDRIQSERPYLNTKSNHF